MSFFIKLRSVLGWVDGVEKSNSMKTSARIHGLDSLRASLMILGVVIHTSLAYFPEELQVWAFQDPSASSWVAVWVLEFIHLFRMPAFFLLSGFFGAMLWTQRSPKKMLLNRIKRVVFPLFVFIVPLYYLGDFASIYAEDLMGGGDSPMFLALGATINWMPENTMHLWFLYYLAWITLFNAAVVALFSALSWHSTRIAPLVRKVTSNPWMFLGVLGLFVSTWAWALGWEDSIPTSGEWIPNGPILLFYWAWYLIGWVIYTSEASFDGFEKRCWVLFFLGIGFWVVGLDWFAVVALVQASLGLFLRFANKASERWRYLSDSAYWVYLLHLPLTIFVPALLLGWPLPFFPKFLCAIALTSVICLVTYGAFVRTTFIGQFLNGRKYPHRDRRFSVAATLLVVSGVVWAGFNPQPPLDRPSPWRNQEQPQVLLGDQPELNVVFPYPLPDESSLYSRSCVGVDALIFCLKPSSYSDASVHCKALGGQLASLETLDEALFVQDLALTLSTSAFYIGLNDLEVESEWTWENGEALMDEESKWSEGEPNSWGGTEEDCAATGWDQADGWVDLPCEHETGFVCELLNAGL